MARYHDAAPFHFRLIGREEEQQTRLLVREEIAGASPVATANFNPETIACEVK